MTVQSQDPAVYNQQLLGYRSEDISFLHQADHQAFVADYASRCPVRQTPDGGLFFLRMRDIVDIQRNPAVSALQAGGSPLGNERPLIPLQIDGARHRLYRRLLNPLFSPRKVAELEPLIETLADELIDKFYEHGSADLYAEFCAPLPATLFVKMIGIPESDIPFFLRFKDDLLRGDLHGDPAEAVDRMRAAGEGCYAYFEELIRARAQAPSEDMVSWLLEADVDGRRLSTDEILDTMFFFMIAGLDTVAAALSCILSWLTRHPRERRQLVEDPALWPGAIEELLRWETPVPNTSRRATADLVVNGYPVPEGTMMYTSWAAANLDPEAFPDPLVVDLRRTNVRHLSFASGFHRCLGSHLARLELKTALTRFHDRIPDYEVPADAVLHYEALPVRLVSPLPVSWK